MGNVCVGTNIRDATCYIIWCIARNKNLVLAQEELNKLAICSVMIALTDREIQCRRAAAAAFQELVGRKVGQQYSIYL